MSKFKVGDKVRIRKGTKYYGRNSMNPADVDGVVTKDGPGSPEVYRLNVRWDNGTVNSYRDIDLELTSPRETSPETKSSFEKILQEIDSISPSEISEEGCAELENIITKAEELLIQAEA